MRMKEMTRDILKDNPQLRKPAHTVPEGYFAAFKDNMAPYQENQTTTFGRLVPYMSLAAAFIFLVTAGTFFLQRSTPAEEFTQEDFVMFSSNLTNTIYYEDTDHLADAGIAEEDIIEYLIYSGISAEEVELAK